MTKKIIYCWGKHERVSWKGIRSERMRGFESHSHRKMAPWRNWIAQQISTLSVTGSSPVGVTTHSRLCLQAQFEYQATAIGVRLDSV